MDAEMHLNEEITGVLSAYRPNLACCRNSKYQKNGSKYKTWNGQTCRTASFWLLNVVHYMSRISLSPAPTTNNIVFTTAISYFPCIFPFSFANLEVTTLSFFNNSKKQV